MCAGGRTQQYQSLTAPVTAAGAMAQYSFPILENDELLPCLEEMEIPLSAADLAKPTYEIVRPLFENVLTTLTGITREELNQPVFTAIDAFEFPELHDESVPCLNFFRQLGRLLSNTGVRDFNLRDVYKPETQRLRRHLSAIVNFAKFREEKLVAYAEMQVGCGTISNYGNPATAARLCFAYRHTVDTTRTLDHFYDLQLQLSALTQFQVA